MPAFVGSNANSLRAEAVCPQPICTGAEKSQHRRSRDVQTLHYKKMKTPSLYCLSGDPLLRRGRPAVLGHAVGRLGRAVERGRVAVRAGGVDPQQRRRSSQGLSARTQRVPGLCACASVGGAELAGKWWLGIN